MPMFSSMRVAPSPMPPSCRRLVGKHPLLPFNRLHDLLFGHMAGMTPEEWYKHLYMPLPPLSPPIIDLLEYTHDIPELAPIFYPRGRPQFLPDKLPTDALPYDLLREEPLHKLPTPGIREWMETTAQYRRWGDGNLLPRQLLDTEPRTGESDESAQDGPGAR